MPRKNYFIFFFCALISVIHNAYGQNQALLEKEAAGFYQKKDYNNALTAYRQLLAKDQLNPSFNFRYGHCLYEVSDQNDAAKYFDLILANQLTADPLVYYYRARIFQHQYFFNKAFQAYEQYEKLTEGLKNAIDVEELKLQCQRGNTEFKNFQTLPFLNIREVALEKFYFKYPFTDEGYSIYEAADVLPKYNAKKGYIPVYCYRRAMKYRIVAAYDGSAQLDLFIQKKDASNNWASLLKIEGVVNTGENEAFGFYDEETQTIYYSSQANSIGGYDLFKAQLDLTTGRSSNQERLSYPYCSPDDDFLYVIDRLQEKVYFASNRAGLAKRCEIFSLALNQEIQQPFIFSGTFNNQISSKNNTASFTFIDLATQTTYGPFLSESDGSYMVVLPQKGSFQLNIQLEGAAETYQTNFFIPVLKEQEQLRQQVIYEVTELGKEKYTVINSIIPANLEQQVELLSKAQVKLQGGELKQTQFSYSKQSSPRSPLLDRFAWPNEDTMALILHLTDSLLAAEVSLENQVRLTEVLRKDFEQKLAQREILISYGPSEALNQINDELVFIKNWLNINQAANIPNLKILNQIQQTNEKLAEWQHDQQSDSILNYLETRDEQLTTFLQIAAFDGERALQIEEQKAQMSMQELMNSIQEEKQILSQILSQMQAQEKSLELQSKKEQFDTKQRIDQLRKQRDVTQAKLSELEQQRALQQKYLLAFDQDVLKEIYLARSERQDLPSIDLSLTMEELFAQYEQQELLLKENSISSQGNLVNEESTSNEGKPVEQSVTSKRGEELKNEMVFKQEITSNQETQTKKEVTSNQENLTQEQITSNEEKEIKEQEVSSQETQTKKEITSNQENLTQEQITSNEEKQMNVQTQEMLDAIEKAATQLKEDEGVLVWVDIPSIAIQKEYFDTLENALLLPSAKIQSEAELTAEQWQPYLDYLEQRDTMEQLKEQITLINSEIKDLELKFLEAPSEALGKQLILKVQQQHVAITALKSIHSKLIIEASQPEFEALLDLGYLPPYELEDNTKTDEDSTTANTTDSYSSISSGASPLSNRAFEIKKQSNTMMIPIGLPCPQGLVFRVQVGAFRKPIPPGKFTEFSPVDARILANGLTVVMVGYFSSSAEALKQRNIIRSSGYTDAFIVAYNGCERMSFANAFQLETTKLSNGKVLPKSSNFETPGDGLYYTVQVGVYNRPLQSEKQLGLPELIEAQTAKGQFRYASGRFDKLSAAKERQRLAVSKGITDAFIVAYYQGKRISLVEAKQMIATGIVMDIKSTKQALPVLKPKQLSLTKVPVLPVRKQLNPTEQLVRYESNCSACSETLAQLNSIGVFTYETSTGKISSPQFKKDDLTALQRYVFKRMQINTKPLQGPFTTIEISKQEINGAQMDWLLRNGLPFSITYKDAEHMLISVTLK